MRSVNIFVIFCCLSLAACAANRTGGGSSEEYVEIDNPAFTMSPNAPATIWVPRSYVESGVPRGGVVLKKGTEMVVDSFRHPSRQSPPATSNQQYTATSPTSLAGNEPAVQNPVRVKSRIALLEVGQHGLVHPLYENLRKAGIAIVLDPAHPAFLARNAAITSQSDKASFAKRLQHDYYASTTIYVTAPEGLAAGKAITAEVFDAMGGGLLRRYDAVIPIGDGLNRSDSNASVSAALAILTDRISELVTLLPWYGRIVEVEGERAYMAAGKESGLAIGQPLNIYRGGRFVEGLGFAPGKLVGKLVVSGFVGPNGSYGVIKEGEGVQAADIVSLE